MADLGHFLLFLLSGLLIWLCSGRLIEAVDRLARRFRQSGFAVAFLVLGFLTSISELSVMANSTITGEPQVSAGNLAGASIVLLLFLVPVLAVLGGGIRLENTLNRTQLAAALFLAALPTLLLLDGGANRLEGMVCVIGYGALLLMVRPRDVDPETGAVEEMEEAIEEVEEVMEEVIEELADRPDPLFRDLLQIAGGAVLIFVAGNFLVEETVYFSRLLSVPSSVIGLLFLSIGTNVPEIVIAIRSVREGRSVIAFGNYIGSSLTNVVLFGLLVLINGGFVVERDEFAYAAVMIGLGFAAFYVFAWSQNRISRWEGALLGGVYAVFVVFQTVALARFAAD